MQIKRLSPKSKIPTYHSSGASGFDLASIEDAVVMPQSTMTISTGLAFKIAEGFEIQIRPRSGLSSKTSLRVIFGTVDSDYRGEVKLIVENLGVHPYFITSGDRIAQGVIAPVIREFFEEVEDFETITERNDNGFGSTGL